MYYERDLTVLNGLEEKEKTLYHLVLHKKHLLVVEITIFGGSDNLKN